MPESSPHTTPTLVSFLICDQIIDDRLTNKKSAIGIFNMVVVPTLPAQIQQMAVLASITEIVQRAELELRLVRDTDDAVVFSGKGSVDAPNPLAVVDLQFAIQGLTFSVAGQYAFELCSHGEILGRRRFMLIHRPKPE